MGLLPHPAYDDIRLLLALIRPPCVHHEGAALARTGRRLLDPEPPQDLGEFVSWAVAPWPGLDIYLPWPTPLLPCGEVPLVVLAQVVEVWAFMALVSLAPARGVTLAFGSLHGGQSASVMTIQNSPLQFTEIGGIPVQSGSFCS